MSTSSRDEAFVGSFAKGLSVIRAFDDEHRSMTLTEVAERTDLPRAGARRFLITLVELGYASTDGKRFELTPRVLELGGAYLRSNDLPRVVTPLLRELSAALEESSSACVLSELEIVYVARVQTRRIMSTDLAVGARLPAAYTSMGRVLLAALTPSERDARLARMTLAPHTRHAITSVAKLRSALVEVREQGYCIVDQELEEGLRSIAVPLRDRSGAVRAAMNISGQANRVTLDDLRRRFLPALLEAAQRVPNLLA